MKHFFNDSFRLKLLTKEFNLKVYATKYNKNWKKHSKTCSTVSSYQIKIFGRIQLIRNGGLKWWKDDSYGIIIIKNPLVLAYVNFINSEHTFKTPIIYSIALEPKAIRITN